MASAHLISNGNALYFDHRGQQVEDLQRLGLSGLHKFIERFPDATVYWTIWRRDGIDEVEVTKEELKWLLRHIRKRPAPPPEPNGHQEQS